MMTAVENLTIEEVRLVEELRSRLKGTMDEELYNDTNMFKRFLIARNYDLNQAEEMLRKHLNWRKVNEIDKIFTEYDLPEAAIYTSINRIGFDRDGHPVIYCNFGNVDTRGLLKCVRKTEITKFMIYTFEMDIARMKDQSKKLEKIVDTFTFIFNFDNFSLINATHKPTLEVLVNFVTMYNDNYPERLKACYMINTTYGFTLLWSVIKRLLTGRTFQKVNVFGREGWKEELVKAISPEVLPAFLGGSRTDPDGNPMCNTFIKHGGKVPERYYAYRKSFCTGLINANKLIVPRRSKAEVKLEVIYPGSSLEIDFETKHKDIGFSLLYKPDQNPKSEVKELIPKQRIESDISTESRVIKCDDKGIYILQFDNSYSWLHQKEVFYKASVAIPKKNKEENNQ